MKLIFLQLIFYYNLMLISGCTIKKSGLRFEDKQLILEKHNNLRDILRRGGFSVLTPKASAAHMLDLEYDECLEEEAQKVANACWEEHNVTEACSDKFESMGQNLIARTSYRRFRSSSADWASVLSSWSDAAYTYVYGGEYTSQNFAYIQMIWYETTHLGCGYAYGEKSYGQNIKVYVCNYGPKGAIQGHLPYIIDPYDSSANFPDFKLSLFIFVFNLFFM